MACDETSVNIDSNSSEACDVDKQNIKTHTPRNTPDLQE